MSAATTAVRDVESAYNRIVPYGVKIKDTPLPIDILTLCGSAKIESEIYCGEISEKRLNIYGKKHEDKVDEIKSSVVISVLKEDKKRISKIMTICITIFTGLGSLAWLAGPLGGAPGTVFGFLAGSAIATAYIHNYVKEKVSIAVEFSGHYIGWLSNAIAEKVYPIFRNFLASEEAFDHLLCPISHDVCSFPMLAPDGKTYDYEHIMEYLGKKTDKDDVKVDSPLRIKPFSKQDLVFDRDYCYKLIEKSKEVYYKVQVEGNNNEIQYGTQAVIDNTMHIMAQIKKVMRFNLWDSLEDAVQEKRITEEQRTAFVKKGVAQWEFNEVN